ncbi:mitotic spindle checkpoint component mad2 [Colletotrichum spaethianum]|uniref:Mitotic spindle checkpoint component mad2 n=1 Tax=Colletotrichum spaethianum TaxID=700344 RepID=A0AA37PFS0_9PEZI|nr:mitotic spindle checkpoint component mad2 [Colletotrichum spaethianum]GKT51412.1 mitotic spindle checkpoint component mad2 [Colletotrichum spaethianum]
MASEAKPAKATKAVKADKADKSDKSDKSKVHKLALKGSAKLVAEFVSFLFLARTSNEASIPQKTSQLSSDDQVRAYIKKIMGQLDRWMLRGKISKLVIVITDKDTGEHVERWQFDVEIFGKASKASKSSKTSKTSSSSKSADQENDAPAAEADATPEKTEQEIQAEIAAIFRQITASVTFLPQLNGDCTFNVLVYADADSEVPVEWGDSDAKEIVNGERVQLRGFSTSNHRVDTLVSYRLAE